MSVRKNYTIKVNADGTDIITSMPFESKAAARAAYKRCLDKFTNCNVCILETTIKRTLVQKVVDSTA